MQKCQTCSSVDDSFADGTIVDTNVWATATDDIIDMTSFLLCWVFSSRDIDRLGKENCFNCKNPSTRLNARSFIKTPKVLIISTNRSLNELAGRLTKTQISISQVLDVGMFLPGFHENADSLSNYVLAEIVQYQGCSIINGHYIACTFQILDL